MKITLFQPVPDYLLERFVPFEQDFNGKNWAELYQMVAFLTEQYPHKHFNDVPYLYTDLNNQTSGLLFVERDTGELFYVHSM